MDNGANNGDLVQFNVNMGMITDSITGMTLEELKMAIK